MEKFKALEKRMKFLTKRADDLSLPKQGKESFSVKDKEIFNYGYGQALKDVLENFFLEEKVNLSTFKKDIDHLINQIKEKFPSCVVSFDNVTNSVPDYMAHLEVDVYMVPDGQILKFEDLCDRVSLEFYQNTKLTIIIISHSVEDTIEFYPEKIPKK